MNPNDTIAHYRILSKLGEGGMGAVYRATDTKLGRDVAIKVLPDSFAADPDRLARFTREAQLLASLNHPNIAAIYGVEERALVMELVEGETLHGPLSPGEAMPLIRQLIDGLEYAHDKGIVHRDLKPANLKLTPEGRLKVLDFGLAKALAADVPAQDPVYSSTLTMRATLPGMIMGTVAYMSPEQARGQSVDRRADIWGFGVVVYELLSGKPLFDAPTVSDTLAAVLTREPDFSAVPARFHRLLRLCLTRDVRERMSHISGARLLLDEPAAQPAPAARASRGPWMAVAAAAAVIAMGALGWAWRVTHWTERPLMRLNVDLGPDAATGLDTNAAISPDGNRLVYRMKNAEGRSSLAIRALDQSKPVMLSGTTEGSDFIFSPDGQWVAFFADGKLKKIGANGGAPVNLADNVPNARGAAWLSDGSIVFAPSPASGLMRIPAAGGKPERLTDPSRHGQVTHRWPQALPGARFLLFTAHTSSGDLNNAEIDALDLRTGQWKTIQQGGFFGRYVPSGHLLYVRDGALFAAAFDADRPATRGTPVPILDDVASIITTAAGRYSFSDTGLFTYVSGKAAGTDKFLVWLDRSAPPQRLPLPAGYYSGPAISPDGRRAIVGVRSDEIRILDLNRETFMPLVSNVETRSPHWSPDGRHVFFTTYVNGATTICSIRSDRGGEPVRIWESRAPIVFDNVSPNGRHLLFQQISAGTDRDLWTLPLDLSDPDAPKAAGTPQPYLQTPAAEFNGAFSADGKWVAYESNLGGRPNVYVRPFPGPGGNWMVSTGMGKYPRWSPAGQRLFFTDAENRILSVEYEVRGDAFVAGKPQLWNDQKISATLLTNNRGYFDVAPDGKRVLALISPDVPEEKQNAHVTFLFNFFDELKRRLP